VRSHVIDVGPTSIRRLCCGGATVVDLELERSAFECIDDTLALFDVRPVGVASLWLRMLESIHCGAEAVTVIHPSWWSSARIDVVAAAANTLVDGAEVRTRSSLLAPAGLIVEVADDFVVIIGTETVVERRCGRQAAVADAVVRAVLTMAGDTVVIDAPSAVPGAGALAAAVAKAMPTSSGIAAVLVDDLRFRRIAGELKSSAETHRAAAVRPRWPLASLVLLAALPVGVGSLRHHPEPPHFLTTLVVEGHVAVEVPAEWTMRRIVAGPGSARVQFTSTEDPEVALHVTQSRVALPGLDATADFLKRAIDEAPDRVFVDFNPADRRAERPVVTYREVRSGHDIRWSVWVDKAIRISIGCQSRSGHAEAVDDVCELAVRSARAMD
jgi:type VII secretion-associated protein (TIGR03931 family)